MAHILLASERAVRSLFMSTFKCLKAFNQYKFYLHPFQVKCILLRKYTLRRILILIQKAYKGGKILSEHSFWKALILMCTTVNLTVGRLIGLRSLNSFLKKILPPKRFPGLNQICRGLGLGVLTCHLSHRSNSVFTFPMWDFSSKPHAVCHAK